MQIDRLTGHLTLGRALDAENVVGISPEGVYDVKIVATNGTHRASTRLQVRGTTLKWKSR